MSEINIPTPAPQLRTRRRPLRNVRSPREGVGFGRLISLADNITTDLQNSQSRRDGMAANLEASQSYKAAQFDAIDSTVTPLERVDHLTKSGETIQSDFRSKWEGQIEEEEIDYILQLHGGNAEFNVNRSARLLDKDITKGLHTERGRDIYSRMNDASNSNDLLLINDEVGRWGDEGFKAGIFSAQQREQAIIAGEGEAENVYALGQIDINPAQALQDLRDKEQYNNLDKHDEKARFRLIRMAETAIASQAGGRDKQLLVDFKAHEEAVEEFGRGQPDIWARVNASNMKRGEIARLRERESLAKDFFSTRLELGVMPPLDRQARVEESRPKNPSDRNFDLQNAHYGRLLDETAKIEELERNDPVKLGLRYIDNPSEDSQTRFRQLDNYYDKINTPLSQREYLLDSVAGRFERDFDEAGTDGKVSLLMQMKAEFGEKHSEAIFLQLQDKGMPFAAVAYRDAPVGDYRKIMESQEFTAGDMNRLRGQPQDKAMMETAAANFKEYGMTLTPGDQQTSLAIDHNNTHQKLTAYLFSIKGDSGAADTAFKMLFGNGYVFDDTMRIPTGYASFKPAIVKMGRDIQDSLSGKTLYRGGLTGDGIPPGVFGARVATDGEWYLNDTETGYELFLDGVPVLQRLDVEGQPSFNRIRFALVQAKAAGNPTLQNLGAPTVPEPDPNALKRGRKASPTL